MDVTTDLSTTPYTTELTYRGGAADVEQTITLETLFTGGFNPGEPNGSGQQDGTDYLALYQLARG